VEEIGCFSVEACCPLWREASDGEADPGFVGVDCVGERAPRIWADVVEDGVDVRTPQAGVEFGAAGDQFTV